MDAKFISEYKQMVDSISLEDISLVSLSVKRIKELSEDLMPLVAECKISKYTHTTNKKHNTLSIKYPITFCVSDETKKCKIIELKAVYVIIYQLKSSVPKNIVEEFIKRNVSVNIHPFIRELIHSVLPRMGYPPFTLPLLKTSR